MAPKCSIDSPWNKILHIFDISAQTGSKNLKKGLTGIGDRKLHLNSFSAIFDTSCFNRTSWNCGGKCDCGRVTMKKSGLRCHQNLTIVTIIKSLTSL